MSQVTVLCSICIAVRTWRQIDSIQDGMMIADARNECWDSFTAVWQRQVCCYGWFVASELLQSDFQGLYRTAEQYIVTCSCFCCNPAVSCKNDNVTVTAVSQCNLSWSS